MQAWTLSFVRSFVVAVALATVGSAAAMADSPARPLTLPGAGQFRANLHLEISLADGAFFEPASVSPDLYYGLSESFVLAITHSASSQGVLGAGRSLRLDSGDAYDNTGLEFFYKLLSVANIDIAGQASLLVDSYTDDFFTSLKVGALVNVELGPVTAIINPYISLPLNDSGVRDNGVFVPAWFFYGLTQNAELSVVTGLNDEALQLGVGFTYDLSPVVDIGAHIGWPRLVGAGNAADELAISVHAIVEL